MVFSLFRRKKQPPAASADLPVAQVIERDEHNISRKNISPNALKVLYRLGEAGFDAYLVGGCVRDLLLGSSPKDFDVATNATPEEVRQTFRNSRIIGRRFKIVHVRFGREIIEVTTFRGFHDEPNETSRRSRRELGNLTSAKSSSGMLLRDNVYGSIEEDAIRRDFTVNSLYYTVDGFRILDFCGGVDDLDDGLLRMIGDPESRYREDPVRMLRAIRFAAKLDFEIEPNTREPINRLSSSLKDISPARLFDEVIKLFTGGQAMATFEILGEFKVANYLLGPILDAYRDVESPESACRLLELALINTDTRIAQGKSVTPAFLFAALLWPVLQRRLSKQGKLGDNIDFPSLQSAANEVIGEQLSYTAIPKRFSLAAKEIWELQLRLIHRNRRNVNASFNHPRFRAAYDFLLLREESGESLEGAGDWWTQFQNSDAAQQEKLLDSVNNKAGGSSNRRRRRRRRPAGNRSDKQS